MKDKSQAGSETKLETVEPEEQDISFLRDINLYFQRGKFYAIVGKVGSGKSSLLNCMIEEMNMIEGKIQKNGKLAIITQDAFLINNTLRQNVVFGMDFDREKYDRVLDICQLRADISMLPGGDLTEIGERGINLSGG